MVRKKRIQAIAICVIMAGLAAGAAIAVVTQRRRPAPSPAAVAELLRGARMADSTVALLAAAPAEAVGASDAITATYLERLRLGIGSPFRLIEQVLRDPMLPAERQRELAYAILARTYAGESHRVDVPAMALVLSSGDSPMPRAEAHLTLIDSVISRAANPHIAELAVRLSYRLASSSEGVSRRAPAIVAQATSLARDRRLAQRDTRRLLDVARRREVDPLELMVEWRASRSFDVERPVLNAIDSASEREAVALLPALVARIERLADEAVPVAASIAAAPAIGEGAARRMAGLVAMRNSPPQAPVAVTVEGFARAVNRGARSAHEVTARARFLARARNEESLAAEYALLRAREPGHMPESALAVLTSAVAMRAYAQERVWVMGESGPSALAVQARLGLSEIEFDRQIPIEWRPYYLRMLEDAIADVQHVLPAFDPLGMGVHFGMSRLKSRALALHDPGTRTVYLPISTSAGAIAHELAHDLDLQAGIARYGAKGIYRTDHAVRQDVDKLGASVRRLASTQAASAPLRGAAVPSSRPTEVFARSVDWFVAAALAREGRMNGYLSAVQDASVTGYASTSSPGVSPDAGEQMLQVLSEVTMVPPATRAWLERTNGVNAGGIATETMRRVLEAPLTWDQLRATKPADAIEGSTRLLLASDAALRAWACTEASGMGSRVDLMRPLIEEAARARSRGVIRRWTVWAREHSDMPARLRTLGSGPWDPAQAGVLQQQVEDAVLMRVSRDAAGRQPFWAVAVAAGASGCAVAAR